MATPEAEAGSASERRRALRLLIDTARPERHHLWIALLGLLAAALLEAMGPIIAKHFIDHYLLPRSPEFVAIGALLAGAFLAGTLASVLRYLQLARLAGLAMRSVQRLRERVFTHVLRLPMHFFDNAITGQLVSRVTNDTESVKALYVQVLFVMLDSVIVLTGALAAMAWLDWRLMSIVALQVPAVFLIVWLYQRRSAPAVARTSQLRSELNAQMAESISGMGVLQASNATDRFAARFADTNAEHYRSRRTEMRANAWLLRPALDFVNVLLLALVIGVFGLREFDGALTTLEVGVLYAFVSYISRVVEPLIQFTMQFSLLQQSVVAAARVRMLLQQPRSPHSPDGGQPSAGAIRIDRLDFAYKPGEPVLRQLSLDIAAGSFQAIVGHTGSGKSTLLALMLRFYPIENGRIDFDGIALASLGEAAFRAAVGVVPQEPFLLAASVQDNIDMGRGLSRDAIEAAARAAQAHEFITRLEHGYHSPLGEGGARLSVGQKQLLAIARALAGRPRILFLDEATSNIDSDTERTVQEALTALRGKVTIVAIAHRLSTVRDADRIAVLDHGRLVELGAHAELMKIADGTYRRLYELQRMEERDLL